MHYRGRSNDIIEAIMCVFALGILVWIGMEEGIWKLVKSTAIAVTLLFVLYHFAKPKQK
jgi:low affinity Fe/Cu permease